MVAGIKPKDIDSELINQVIEFPAEYGIKIIGLDEPEFEYLVKNILTLYIENNQSIAYAYKKSGQQKYISITCTFIAESRHQLDEIYAHMRSHPKVLMVL